jgi:hypothetical protein
MACSSFVFLPFQRDVTRLPYDTENYIEGETFSSSISEDRDMTDKNLLRCIEHKKKGGRGYPPTFSYRKRIN